MKTYADFWKEFIDNVANCLRTIFKGEVETDENAITLEFDGFAHTFTKLSDWAIVYLDSPDIAAVDITAHFWKRYYWRKANE